MKGSRSMYHGAFKTDQERLTKALEDQAFFDNKPTQPEHRNWVLRKREKSCEIGPTVRFGSTIQV